MIPLIPLIPLLSLAIADAGWRGGKNARVGSRGRWHSWHSWHSYSPWQPQTPVGTGDQVRARVKFGPPGTLGTLTPAGNVGPPLTFRLTGQVRGLWQRLAPSRQRRSNPPGMSVLKNARVSSKVAAPRTGAGVG